MKQGNKIKISVTAAVLCLLLLILSIPANAGLDIGGEIKTAVGLSVNRDGKTNNFNRQEINFKIYPPAYGNTDAKFEIKLYHDSLTKKSDYFVKKLYIEHRFDKFQLTAGRQPVSWSFGSLLNPVDYNTGAVVMEETTNGKFINAVEGYIPINWNSGITAVISFPDNSEELKWGLRNRFGYNGYDINLNIIHEAEMQISGLVIPSTDRIGLFFKGDLGPVGLYGAVGYYDNENLKTTTYLLGTDYSYSLNYGSNKLSFQLEYLNLEPENLDNIIGSIVPVIYTGSEQRVDFILGNVNYTINNFSSVSLMGISYIEDGSTLLIPSYKNQLGSNLDIHVRGGLYLGDKSELFAPRKITEEISIPEGTFEMELSYPF